MKSFKSVFSKAAFMFALVSLSNSFTGSHAQVQPQYIVAKGSAGNIRFVCVEGDMLIFELHLSTVLPKGSTLRVVDEADNVIFEERTSAETFNIRYKIVRNDLIKINFEISNKHFFLNQSFNINSRVEEKVEVTKA